MTLDHRLLRRLAISHYVLDGHRPLPAGDLLTWAKWFETADRHVALDTIGAAHVSTVFLGIDHNYAPEGPPVLFESMVFGGPLDGECNRCCTWEQAETMHALLVERVKTAGP